MATAIGTRLPGPGLRALLEPAAFGITNNRGQKRDGNYALPVAEL
jgi:hypothetical protein